jgi:hypothetical protein
MGEVAVTRRLVAVGRQLINVRRVLVLVGAGLITVGMRLVAVCARLLLLRRFSLLFTFRLAGDDQIPFPLARRIDLTRAQA